MDTAADIPVEIRARVEANTLFEAVRTGDYAAAAQAQNRLRALGWSVTRSAAIPKRGQPRRGAVGSGVA